MAAYASERHRTALGRAALSRPVATALADGILATGDTVFDYGCGKGGDLERLAALGFTVGGWDPAHRPQGVRTRSDVVNLGYVVNVIERLPERSQALRDAWELASKVLIVSARMAWDARGLTGRPFGDGMITGTGTFQKFYDHAELIDWVETTLGNRAHAASPGILYVFRSEAEAQQFVASRVYTFRPRTSVDPVRQYEDVREALEPVLDFMRTHARGPKPSELSVAELERVRNAVGSAGAAERLIRRVTDEDYWRDLASRRRRELLIYIAMSRFGYRPRFSDLDPTLANDIRTFLGNYSAGCREGDALLAQCGDQASVYFAARRSEVGKQTPTALYLHRDAVDELPALLQVLDGCARVLTGGAREANLVKFHVSEPKVSYLHYPGFATDAHPVLAEALIVDLRDRTVAWRNYRSSGNPPVIHRKEEFVTARHPRRELYARLTRAETRAGLYAAPERIGTLRGWEATLDSAGLAVRGHRLVRVPSGVTE
ncbi:DNA phosphorothioation-associated putative methyltransferase [Demequina rhizosphaerae]|uniref:DNA phosphorothioation-associated putative methyltransferase n=1 Tax=Demequina rhizosphaerae TaxID=1638985 RepID=UPI000780519B|nr:DNA phosphorothioation-associated putative methyltransferase [Demequina rhizosphaerae]